MEILTFLEQNQQALMNRQKFIMDMILRLMETVELSMIQPRLLMLGNIIC